MDADGRAKLRARIAAGHSVDLSRADIYALLAAADRAEELEKQVAQLHEDDEIWRRNHRRQLLRAERMEAWALKAKAYIEYRVTNPPRGVEGRALLKEFPESAGSRGDGGEEE